MKTCDIRSNCKYIFQEKKDRNIYSILNHPSTLEFSKPPNGSHLHTYIRSRNASGGTEKFEMVICGVIEAELQTATDKCLIITDSQCWIDHHAVWHQKITFCTFPGLIYNLQTPNRLVGGGLPEPRSTGLCNEYSSALERNANECSERQRCYNQLQIATFDWCVGKCHKRSQNLILLGVRVVWWNLMNVRFCTVITSQGKI